MKRVKILMAILVCVVLTGTTLAGCGSAGNGGETAASGQATTQAATTQAPTTAPANQEPTVIKYLGVTWGDFLADTPGNQRIHDALLKKLNIDVQDTVIQKPEDWAAKINLAIASGEQYDLLYLPPDNNYQLYGQLIDQDYIIPVEDLLQSHGKDLLAFQRPEVLEFLKRNGKIYAWANEVEPCVQCVEIRQDLLDKYGLKYPTTIEEYENAVTTIQAKEKGMAGFLLYWDNLDDVFVQSFVATGNTDWVDPADNKLKPYFLAPGFKDYLAAMAKFYKEGILPKEYLTMKSDQINNLVNSGKAISFTSFGAPNAPWSDQMLIKVVPDGKYVALKPLTGTQNAGYTADIGVVEPFAITKNSKVPEKVMDFANYVAGTVEGYALAAYGEDGVDYFSKSVSADKIIIDMAKTVTTQGADLYSGIYRAGITNKMRHSVMEDGVERWYQMMSEFKLCKGVTYGMSIDTTKFKSKDVITDLDDLYKQERNKVIVGQTSAADWDTNFIQKYLKMGGSQYIEDMTQQYSELKNAQK